MSMRRAEFSSTAWPEIHEVLDQAEIGSLGIIVADGSPRVIPVNFARVSMDGMIGFHCAMEGEKWEAFQSEPFVTFSAIIPHAIIPSYWTTNTHASGATHYFKSVQINGQLKVVTQPTEKAYILQALMEKYQPEGQYLPVAAEEPMYVKSLKETGVIEIRPERVTAKMKFGQNLPEHTRLKLIELLNERGRPIDLATAEEIRKRF